VIYFDASYLVRLYLDDAGAERVRALAATEQAACSLHGRTELVAAMHRAYRDGRFNRTVFLQTLDQFQRDDKAGIVGWLIPEQKTHDRAENAFRAAGASIFLRAADAMHLACAAENGFREIYSNDRHLLAAAPLFGLRPKNVIG
jgi:predicted nucleic acid-binding protein